MQQLRKRKGSYCSPGIKASESELPTARKTVQRTQLHQVWALR